MPIGRGNLFLLVLESHGKVMEIDYPKRVVTLFEVLRGILLYIFHFRSIHHYATN